MAEERDVKLVISAKNEASGALGQITKSIDGFKEKAGEISSAMTRTGFASEEMAKKAKTASAAIKDMTGGAMAQAEVAMGKLASRRDNLSEKLKSQSDRATKAAEAHAKEARAVKDLQTRLEALNKAIAAAPTPADRKPLREEAKGVRAQLQGTRFKEGALAREGRARGALALAESDLSSVKAAIAANAAGISEAGRAFKDLQKAIKMAEAKIAKAAEAMAARENERARMRAGAALSSQVSEQVRLRQESALDTAAKMRGQGDTLGASALEKSIEREREELAKSGLLIERRMLREIEKKLGLTEGEARRAEEIDRELKTASDRIRKAKRAEITATEALAKRARDQADIEAQKAASQKAAAEAAAKEAAAAQAAARANARAESRSGSIQGAARSMRSSYDAELDQLEVAKLGPDGAAAKARIAEIARERADIEARALRLEQSMLAGLRDRTSLTSGNASRLRAVTRDAEDAERKLTEARRAEIRAREELRQSIERAAAAQVAQASKNAVTGKEAQKAGRVTGLIEEARGFDNEIKKALAHIKEVQSAAAGIDLDNRLKKARQLGAEVSAVREALTLAEGRANAFGRALGAAGSEASADLRRNLEKSADEVRKLRDEFLRLETERRQALGGNRQTGGAGAFIRSTTERAPQADPVLQPLPRIPVSAILRDTIKDMMNLRAEANDTGRAVAASSSRIAAAWRAATASISGDSRKALDMMQRIRGQALSLAASYVGIFAVVDQAKRVVDTFQQIEAARSRLNMVFNGDQGAVGQELIYLREQAERFGFEMTSLTDDYTRFAVAASAVGVSGEDTRKVFEGVSAAARVNKLTTEQVSRAYVALGQSFSKNQVTMEELRSQLSEAIPGAVALFAQSMGYASSEMGKFYKDVEAGKFDGQSIVKFGEYLSKEYAGSLDQASKSFQAEFARLQNELFDARASVGNMGFIVSAHF